MEYLLKSSALILVFYLCYKLLLQRDTFFENNRLYFAFGIVAAILLPLIVIPIYITVEPQQSSFIISETSNLGSIQQIREASFNWNQFIIILYFLGVCIFGLRLLIQFFSLASLIFRNKKHRVGKYIYVKVKDSISPFSFFNWIVFNPNQFEENELEQIITHEKVHAKQYHSIDMLLIQLASVILWCNPFIWLFKKSLEQNLEFIADAKTQKQTSCEKSYQQLLLKTSIPNHQLAFANNFYNSLIKKRIVMLHKSKSHKRNQWKLIAIIPLLALFLMSFGTEKIYIETLSSDKVFTISADTNSKSLKTIENAFIGENVKLKFTDLVRNDKGEIQRISINTKYPTDKRFFKRMTLNNNLKVKSIEPFNLIYKEADNKIDFSFVEKEMTSHLSQDKISFSGTNSVSTFKNSNSKPILNLGDIEVAIVSKKMTKSQLDAIKKQFKEHDVTIKFSGIKRNSDDEIIKIEVSASTKNSKAKYEADSGKPISPITIQYDSEDNNIMIGSDSSSSNGMRFVSRGGKHKIETHGKGSNVFTFSDSDHDETHDFIIERNGKKRKIRSKSGSVHIISDDDHKEIIEDEDKFIIKTNGKTKTIKKSSEDSVYIISDEDDHDHHDEIIEIKRGDKKGMHITFGKNEKPLILLDGKEISKKEMEALDSDTIKTMEVIKGDNTMEKYGKKAKDGVVIITSKNKK